MPLIGPTHYAMGAASSTPSGCPAAESTNDKSGRIQGVWVTPGDLTLGTPSGDPIYSQQYQWTGNQVVASSTCLVDAGSPIVDQYTYDSLTRLVGADGGLGPTGGDAFGRRTYGYDRRGNRTAETQDGASYTLSYAGNSDQLTRWRAAPKDNWLQWNYSYGPDGAVKEMYGPTDSQGNKADIVFQSGPGGSGSGATDTVYQSVSVNGASYGYFYDAKGRRRFEQYPNSLVSSEWFYGPGNQMIIDAARTEIVGAVVHAFTEIYDDDYIWLGGRPVAVDRGFHLVAGSIYENEQVNVIHFLISDALGRPVLTMDGERRISGVGQYDPYGQVNRVALDAETAHRYRSFGTIGTMTQAPTDALATKMRAKFQMIDMGGANGMCGSNPANTTDRVAIKDVDGNVLWSATGEQVGPIWSYDVTSDGGAASIVTDYTGCYANSRIPYLRCNCITPPRNEVAEGVIVEGYEYQRYDPDALPYWTPLRLPGQYHDEETDLNQNWNRFYNPEAGGYTHPEPMWLHPKVALAGVRSGTPWPVYGYANDNGSPHVPVGSRSRRGLGLTIEEVAL